MSGNPRCFNCSNRDEGRFSVWDNFKIRYKDFSQSWFVFKLVFQKSTLRVYPTPVGVYLITALASKLLYCNVTSRKLPSGLLGINEEMPSFPYISPTKPSKVIITYPPLGYEYRTSSSGRAASLHTEPGDGTCQAAAAFEFCPRGLLLLSRQRISKKDLK